MSKISRLVRQWWRSTCVGSYLPGYGYVDVQAVLAQYGRGTRGADDPAR